jgi:ankyrin repeat protein
MIIPRSALHLATFAGYLEMTETILLQRDKPLRAHQEVFDVDEADNLSLTPLMKAAINGHLEVSNLVYSFSLDSKTSPEIRGES